MKPCEWKLGQEPEILTVIPSFPRRGMCKETARGKKTKTGVSKSQPVVTLRTAYSLSKRQIPRARKAETEGILAQATLSNHALPGVVGFFFSPQSILLTEKEMVCVCSRML